MQAGGATERRARRNRGGPKFLETVAEENGHDEEEQKEEEEPIIAVAPEPSHAPVVEEPKPAAKVTRARRGKKANTEPEKPTDEPVAAPEEPAQDGKFKMSFVSCWQICKLLFFHCQQYFTLLNL